jgi:signal transduction histidine kinase
MKTTKKNLPIDPGITEEQKSGKQFLIDELFYRQKLTQQELQQLKILTQTTIDNQEQERLQISKKLHDSISQHLITTRLYMEMAKEKASGELLEMISHAHKNLTDVINEIRQLSQSLVPHTLADIGLIESIRDLCIVLSQTNSFQVEFHHHCLHEETIPENMKIMLFRMIQEQVNNIIRHADASEVNIKLQADAEQVILSINDNGRGFDLSQQNTGMGLTNMLNRVSLFDGKTNIDSTPGKGCTVTITVPLLKAT